VRIETDYLVVGAGATGLAFTDSLIEGTDAEVTLVDRRPAPGGHWLDAYPFVRLHTPSAYYGVSSLPLGRGRIDETGENAGYYERATGEEVRDHFSEAAARLTGTGRVLLLIEHEHVGKGADGERVRDLRTGEVHDVAVRRKVVDARYLEGTVPATHDRSFEVASDARVVPVNELPAAAGSASTFAVLGSGKTAVDACTWLLEEGIDAGRIRWVRPRDAWFYDREHFQPLEQVGSTMEGFALDAEAGADAASLGDLVERLEASARLFRIDPSEPATMYRGTMLSARELEALRTIEDVVRLGRVRRIESDLIVLERGEVETGPETVSVDCTAYGIRRAPATPIFESDRIVIQPVRQLQPTFNAALVGWAEAHRDDDTEKNRLCPPNPYVSTIEEWPRMTSRTWRTERAWLREPDLMAWVNSTRLNLLGALPDHATEPSVQGALTRFLANVAPATERLERFDGAAPLARHSARRL
jgi:hypothetical protein